MHNNLTLYFSDLLDNIENFEFINLFVYMTKKYGLTMVLELLQEQSDNKPQIKLILSKIELFYRYHNEKIKCVKSQNFESAALNRDLELMILKEIKESGLEDNHFKGNKVFFTLEVNKEQKVLKVIFSSESSEFTKFLNYLQKRINNDPQGYSISEYNFS